MMGRSRAVDVELSAGCIYNDVTGGGRASCTTTHHSTMTVIVERVTDTSPATVDKYAELIARAFRPIPFTKLLSGFEGEGDDDPGWLRLLARLKSEVYAGVRDLEVWSARREGDGEPGAAMIIAPPGVEWGKT